MRLAARLLLVLALLFGAAGGSAAAQTSPLAPRGGEAAQTEETARSEAPGLWGRTVLFIQAQQRALHRELAEAVQTLKAQDSMAAAWSLILIAFLYGVFHAAGPGHGKAVISAYLLTHESRLRRGIVLSVASALLQGVTAVVLVQGFVVLVGWTRRDAQDAVGTLESLSFALIAALGLYLVYSALRGLLRLRKAKAGALDRHHHHGHEHGPGCGHAHMPDPAELGEKLTARTALSMILSIGIRPCSGGVLVLLFAVALGLTWAGIAAVFAMSIGTAITVSALASLAVGSRQLARRLAKDGEGRAIALAAQGAALAGGLLISAMGLSLFIGSLGPQHPLL